MAARDFSKFHKAREFQLSKKLQSEISGDSKKFLVAMQDLWNEMEAPKRYFYHCFLPTAGAEKMLKLIAEAYPKGTDILPYVCTCKGDIATEHDHVVLFSPVELERKHRDKLSRLVVRYLPPQGSSYKVKKINSRVHLIHTIIYIQTKHTKGFGGDRGLKHKSHYHHHEKDCVFDSKSIATTYKKHVLYKALKGFSAESRNEWDAFEEKRTFSTMESLGNYGGRRQTAIDDAKEAPCEFEQLVAKRMAALQTEDDLEDIDEARAARKRRRRGEDVSEEDKATMSQLNDSVKEMFG